MTITPIGKVASVTPGTPVPLSLTSLKCHYIVVSQVPGTMGKVYLKFIRNQVAAGVILRAFLPPGASGFLDEHRVDGNCMIDPLDAADWAVDADNTTEGMYVYAVTE